MTFEARFSRGRASRRLFDRLLVDFLIMLAVGGVAAAGNKPAWIELRSPNFIVVTNAGEAQARRTVYQFEMIRAVFRAFFGQKQNSAEQPVIILAAKDENTLKALLPEFWQQKGASHPAGIYLGGTDADYIALRLDLSLNQEAYEPFEPVYHEYVHYLTRRLIAHLPLWMVEGLAEFYGNTQIRSKDVYLGAPSTSNLLILQEQQPLPVTTLIEIDASSPYYHEQNKTSIFYAESWALTHYLVARDWKENTHRMTDFLKSLVAGADPKDAAAQTLGDMKALDDPLRRYIRSFSFTAIKAEAPKIDENGFRVRPMTDAEAEAVRADFMGHDRHYAEAQQMLEEALKADPKLGVAYDGLSFLALQQNNSAEGEKWSSLGLSLDPQDYRANYYHAWSLMKAGRIDEESLAKAEASLRTVLKGNPEFVPAYDAMAYVLDLEGGKEKLDEAYRMTLQALTREPGNLQYRLRAVEVLERQQRAADAVRVATLAVSMAKTAEERQAASAALAGAKQFQGIPASQAEAEGSANPEQVVPTSGGRAVTGQVNAAAGLVVISNPQGVDLSSYISQDVMPKIQQQWSAQIQKVSAETAVKKGTVVVEFAIEKDGSVADMQTKESTKEQALDDVARGAILAAAPFPPLPAKFRGKTVALRFQCEYNPGTARTGRSGQGTGAGEQKGEEKSGGKKSAEN